MELNFRYFIKLAYRGTNYHGWQIQPNANSVQETLEKAMSLIFRETISLMGAGRTDTGVHASTYFAHFNIDSKYIIEELQHKVYKLNSMLPNDIVVYDIYLVKNEAHARFDAVSRTYQYFIHTTKNPFSLGLSYYFPRELDIELMNKACQILKTYTDFTSFAKLHADNKTNNCKIYHANWENFNGQIVFTIKADRFLRNMVRAIVGTMLEVGLNKISIDEFKAIIENKNRCSAGKSVEPQGLFLCDIEYPDSIFKVKD